MIREWSRRLCAEALDAAGHPPLTRRPEHTLQIIDFIRVEVVCVASCRARAWCLAAFNELACGYLVCALVACQRPRFVLTLEAHVVAGLTSRLTASVTAREQENRHVICVM